MADRSLKTDGSNTDPASAHRPKTPSSLSIPVQSIHGSQSPTTPTQARLDPLELRAAALSDPTTLDKLTAKDIHRSPSRKPSSDTMTSFADSDQSAMSQVLSGILSMQKEVCIRGLCACELC